MADQKDQHQDPCAEDQTLPGSSKAPDSAEYSDDEDMVNQFVQEFKKDKLEELQRKALSSLLQAFKAETPTLSDKRTEIIEKLMKEWNIAHKTQISSDNIQKHLLSNLQRSVSSSTKIVQARPPILPEEKETPIQTHVVSTSGSRWGSVNPESLVGQFVCVRMPDEVSFKDFLIREYDAEHEKHQLEAVGSDAMGRDAMLSWMDVRDVPPEHIMWQGGVRPNFDDSSQPK